MEIIFTNQAERIWENNSNDSINVLITGDFYSGNRISELVKTREYNKIFNDFIPFVNNADISITNLECPLTLNTTPILKSGPSLKGPPETADALRFAGFNIVCLANNHIMDYGETGLTDTIDSLTHSEIKFVGAGRNIDEARNPLFIKTKGLIIAFINITEHEFSIGSSNTSGAAPLDEVDNFYQIQSAREKADIVILIIHGGHEMFSYPSPRMVKLYRYFADLGVHAITGHHPHVYSGYEVFKGVPIFYSLGNFIFDRKNPNEAWSSGFAVLFEINKDGISKINLIPYKQCYLKPGVQILKDEELSYFKKRLEKYCDIIADEKSLSNEFNSFIQQKRVYYLSVLLGLGKLTKQLLKMNYMRRLLYNKKSLRNRLNQIRCQAHRDVIVEIIKKEGKLPQ